MDGKLRIELADERPLGVIADEFDGVEVINRESKEQGNATYEGYSRLVAIQRLERTGMVQITLAKG